MTSENLGQIGLLLVGLSLLIASVGGLLVAVGIARIGRAKLTPRNAEQMRLVLGEAVSSAVRAAEIVGRREGLDRAGRTARAIGAAKRYLDIYGVSLPDDVLSECIAAEEFRLYHEPLEGALSRSAIVDRAVEAAVLAAEQSAAQGYIENVDEAKKHYALAFAGAYLEEHCVRLDNQLIEGLIEAVLIRHGAGMGRSSARST